jgi:hypothetical protein
VSATLLKRSGWRLLTIEGKNPRNLPIQDSVLCVPNGAASLGPHP